MSVNGSNARRRVVLNATFTPSDDQVADTRRYLLAHMEREQMNPVALASGGRALALALLRAAVNEGRIANVAKNPPEGVVHALYEYALGLGALETFLANPQVEQINIHGPRHIFIQSNGNWSQVTDERLLFAGERELRRVIESLARRDGRELSPATHPIMDISFDRPVLRIHINQTGRGGKTAVFIRRGRSQPFTVEQLIKSGDFDRPVANLLIEAAQRLIGCVFIGPVGTGKTVLLEMFVGHMPNVPIIVVDDGGDCTPAHPFVASFRLPGTAYGAYDQQVMTLGGMTKAALREGDVLVIAEIRGAEEAGIAIADAPSMRCVTTTVHGDTPQSGLSRLVSIAQRPPSPYAGAGSADALRRDVASAFPLVVQMDRAGDRRFVAGVYHNRGWQDGTWQLAPLVVAEHTPGGEVVWKTSGSIDDVRREKALDRIRRVRGVAYEAGDPRRLYLEAMGEAEAGNLPAATHKLFRSLLLQDAEQTREQLAALLARTGESERVQAEAERSARLLRDYVARRQWGQAKALLKEINQRSVRVYMRKVMPDYAVALADIEAGEREMAYAAEVARSAQAALQHDTRWDVLELMVEQLGRLNLALLDEAMLAQVKAIHLALLARLARTAPRISRPYFLAQQEKLI